jgi:hypothetical protein
MKTLDELKEFYQTTLLGYLEGVEETRKQLVRKLMFVGIGLLCVAGFMSLFLLTTSGEPFFIFFIIIGCAVIGGFVCKAMSRGYVVEFKLFIIEQLIKFVDESLDYSSNDCVPQGVYMLSQIFKTEPDRYRGDDLVSGKVGATKIRFSEIHSEYKTHDKNGTHWHTIFKGLFFVGDFNKDFTCRVVVLPDTAENLFGNIGQMFQSWNKLRGELIKLEDPEFEKLFVVYGNDQVQARYILSTSLMKRIVDFKRKTNRRIYLSFVGSMIFVAVSYNEGLFEPRIFRTMLDFKPIQEYFEDLALAIGIVEDLNLNTRIWSKD